MAPMMEVREDQRLEVNMDPLSDVMCRGTPNREIQCWRRAEAHSSAVALRRGMVSGHLVDLSIIVNR